MTTFTKDFRRQFVSVPSAVWAYVKNLLAIGVLATLSLLARWCIDHDCLEQDLPFVCVVTFVSPMILMLAAAFIKTVRDQQKTGSS